MTTPTSDLTSHPNSLPTTGTTADRLRTLHAHHTDTRVSSSRPNRPGITGGPVPVDYAGVIVEGPHRTRRLAPLGWVFGSVAGLVDRLFVTAVWTALPIAGGLVLTGHGSRIGLSDTPTGLPVPLIAAASIALIIVAVIAFDVIRFGRRNTTASRTDRTSPRDRASTPTRDRDDPDTAARGDR